MMKIIRMDKIKMWSTPFSLDILEEDEELTRSLQSLKVSASDSNEAKLGMQKRATIYNADTEQ